MKFAYSQGEHMSLTMIIVFLIVGLIVGIISGMVGIGGGLLLVPVFVLFFGFSYHLAAGTTLALMVPPIGILAAYEYYKHGHVDIKIAIIICIGFLIGGFFGAKLAQVIPASILRKGFSLLLAYTAVKMFLKK